MQDECNSQTVDPEYFTRSLDELDSIEWPKLWARPCLDARQRSLISIGIVAAQGRFEELASQVVGALNSGCTKEEIQEAIFQAAPFGGREVARKALHTADAAVKRLARWRPRG
ncbi:alkylhydroperoxidase/carboxymuconolactone decarboxylase family protein YurZ [Rhodococcus sp. 27YEA15]|uniref:carboxymuconolactone decarboxylase family protein n=1 Tax=Rhodococcus sp. 27YEA15 TaxID=3156259 RepID=UPI003C7CA750